ncbi:MAG: hypothetical protein ABIG95_01555 [Candidatus Woesearchaeota archaeon]
MKHLTYFVMFALFVGIVFAQGGATDTAFEISGIELTFMQSLGGLVKGLLYLLVVYDIYKGFTVGNVDLAQQKVESFGETWQKIKGLGDTISGVSKDERKMISDYQEINNQLTSSIVSDWRQNMAHLQSIKQAIQQMKELNDRYGR